MTVVLFAPLWQDARNVGNYRLNRFVRWLAAAGDRAVVVRVGPEDHAEARDWGVEIAIRDPLGLPDGSGRDPAQPLGAATPGLVADAAYLAAYTAFSPDPRVLWARRAAAHPLVAEACRGADWVLSSSPPESAHVGAWLLARRVGAKLAIDMRDGWLDEPLKPLLRSPGLHRWREARLERRILQDATRVLVTSEVWKELLAERLPFTAAKTTTLTNGYPPEAMPVQQADPELTLLHAGRFIGSRLTHQPNRLLLPLLAGLAAAGEQGRVLLQGRMARADLNEIEPLVPRYAAAGWALGLPAPVARPELLERLCRASGLLLLSWSHAAIVSKVFEYLPARRPILAATPRGSAVWRLGDTLPHVFLLDGEADAQPTVARFLEACRQTAPFAAPPEAFSEASLARTFLAALGAAPALADGA